MMHPWCAMGLFEAGAAALGVINGLASMASMPLLIAAIHAGVYDEEGRLTRCWALERDASDKLMELDGPVVGGGSPPCRSPAVTSPANANDSKDERTAV